MSCKWFSMGLLTFVAVLSAGCATYVNVPSHPADVARNDPNIKTVQQVEVAAAQAVLAEFPLEGEFLVALPEGTSAETYEAVVPKIGDNARWSSEPSTAMPTVDLRQLRVRGSSAEVDVIRPTRANVPAQLVTTYLQWDPISGWVTKRMRVWRISVDDALAASRRGFDVQSAP